MKFFKLSLITLTAAAFLTGCSTVQNDDAGYVNPYPADAAENQSVAEQNAAWARENLDLQAVGSLLEKSKNAEEFEYLLNSGNGVNNLDLNGDGYTDYISVSEYEDRDSDQRGFTLFDRFGLNEIQEIARIFFTRDSDNDRGARILLNGNEQLYGDNYYYETDWQDRTLPITDWVFGNRDNYYQSPYYYDNYPNNYEPYHVVETPVYLSRIQEYYPAPVFIKTVNPTVKQIKIKSPYNGRSMDKIFAKLAKPTKEQKEFRKDNPNRPEFVPVRNGKMKDDSFKNNDRKDRNDFDKSRKSNNDKFENRNKSDKPNRIERENIQPDKPNKVQRENVKPDKPNKEGKGGGGNGKGGGNGGGKGKKN